jgi:glycosyltransferase involved in cell wall biosynthesis
MNNSAESPFFSIIIPTYNHAYLIVKCLDSLINQSYSNWEAIVVNNFSEDDTVNVVDSYADKRIRLFNFKNNGVIAASRNYGAKMSTGKWICFLDSDDWYTNDRLEVLSKLHLDSYDLIYHSLFIYTNGEIGRSIPVRQLNVTNPHADLLYNLNTIPTSSTCIKRDFFLNSGGFNEARDLIGMEDFDLWIRLAKAGMKAKLIDKELGYYYVGDSNITYKDERQINRLTTVYKQYIDNPGDLSGRKIQGALDYLIARVYLSVAQKRKASKLFLKSFFKGSAPIKIRSFYYLLRSSLG